MNISCKVSKRFETYLAILQLFQELNFFILYSLNWSIPTFLCSIVIVNEQFTVTNASSSQQDAYLKQAAPTPSSSPVLDPQAGPSTSAYPDANIQMEMVRQFSQQSGMNADFSQKWVICAWTSVGLIHMGAILSRKVGGMIHQFLSRVKQKVVYCGFFPPVSSQSCYI